MRAMVLRRAFLPKRFSMRPHLKTCFSYVFGSKIIRFAASQSSWLPGESNIVSVTFSSSMPLLASSRIIFAGLTGTQTLSGAVQATFCTYGSESTAITTTGSWQQSNGTPILVSSMPTVAGMLYMSQINYCFIYNYLSQSPGPSPDFA